MKIILKQSGKLDVGFTLFNQYIGKGPATRRRVVVKHPGSLLTLAREPLFNNAPSTLKLLKDCRVCRVYRNENRKSFRFRRNENIP